MNRENIPIPAESLCIAIDSLDNLPGVEVGSPENLHQRLVVEVVCKRERFMFTGRPGRTIDVPLYPRHPNPAHPRRLLVVRSEKKIDRSILEGPGFEDVLLYGFGLFGSNIDLVRLLNFFMFSQITLIPDRLSVANPYMDEIRFLENRGAVNP